MRNAELAPLSGAPQGGIIAGLAAEAGRTTVHEVPAGETHRVVLKCNNTHASTAIRILGDYVDGDTDQTYDMDIQAIAARTFVDLLDHVFRGPCRVRLAAVANQSNANISGYVEKVRH